MKRYLFAILSLAIISLSASSHTLRAQELVWNLGFDFRFDNREYGDPSRMVAPSETIFGANIMPEMGIAWGYGHSIITGANLHADMGSESFFGNPEFIAYYNYSSPISPLKASLGLFPRSKLRGEYSRAIFDDTYRFFHPTIEGALISHAGKHWFAELACDWSGLRSATRREMFTLIMSSEARKGITFAGLSATLHHHAASDTARGVVDNGIASFYLGVSIGSLLGIDELSLQGSWLQAYQNDRHHIGTPIMPNGYELTLRFSHKELGVIDTFYKGDDLMPYWNLPYEDAAGSIYGSNLYSGDPFYRVGESGFYNRLELFWQPYLKDGVSLRFSSVHHYDGAHWGWQQLISLSVDIGSRMFSPIR